MTYGEKYTAYPQVAGSVDDLGLLSPLKLVWAVLRGRHGLRD